MNVNELKEIIRERFVWAVRYKTALGACMAPEYVTLYKRANEEDRLALQKALSEIVYVEGFKVMIYDIVSSSEYDRLGGMSIFSHYVQLYRSVDEKDKLAMTEALSVIAQNSPAAEVIIYAELGEDLAGTGIFHPELSAVIKDRVKEMRSTQMLESSVLDDLERMSDVMLDGIPRPSAAKKAPLQ